MPNLKEMVSRVRSGQDPSEVIEGVLRKTSIISKSRSSLAGRKLSRAVSTSRDTGWEYRLSTDGSEETEISAILKAIKTKGSVAIIAPGSNYPLALVSYGATGWSFDIKEPPDFPINLPRDPEIRNASARTHGKHNSSEARRFISLIVKKIRWTKPLESRFGSDLNTALLLSLIANGVVPFSVGLDMLKRSVKGGGSWSSARRE